ncbi:hypothetical protein PG996_008930 [Apiospora saccharicola]|uniref:NGG1p interacting factor 3 n=1 Tax=Apiospora saccharicola TaxID=335842 RepID=A0ABR1V2P5_9PEZI
MQQGSGAVSTLPIRGPTIAEISAFLQSLLPVRQGDVAFDYHSPRSRFFHPGTARPTHMILSITPTPGFYDALTKAASQSPRSTPLGFLHRPWELDPRRAFDEVLTVGNNAVLAAKLGMDMDQAGIIQGYKGDPERTIGIVGPLVAATARAMPKSQLETEFGSFEGAFGFDDDDDDAKGKDGKEELAASGETDHEIRCVAIMNAFHPEEVDQVAGLAVGMGLAPSLEDCRGVLYLTGAVREPGLEAARKKGMAVVCVGHRTCEEWGIRHLARVFRERWPGLQVDEVLEAEEPRVVVKKGKSGKGQATTQPTVSTE